MDAEHKKEYWQRMLANLVLLIMVALSLFLFSACAPVEPQNYQETAQVIRIGTDYKKEDLGYQQLQIFAQTVSEKSNGAIEVKVYATEEWSPAESFIEYLDAGALEMVCLPSIEATKLQPMYEIYQQPYLFSNMQAVETYLSGNGAQKALQQLPEKYYGVGFVADGYAFWMQGLSAEWVSYGTVKHLAEIHELKDTPVYDVRAVYHLHPLLASQTWWSSLTKQAQQWIVESYQDSLKSIYIHQKEIAPKRLTELGVVLYQTLPAEQAGLMEKWLNQRELYLASHSDILTAYWRPTVITTVIGEEI